jgi:hypothetical protein
MKCYLDKRKIRMPVTDDDEDYLNSLKAFPGQAFLMLFSHFTSTKASSLQKYGNDENEKGEYP